MNKIIIHHILWNYDLTFIKFQLRFLVFKQYIDLIGYGIQLVDKQTVLTKECPVTTR